MEKEFLIYKSFTDADVAAEVADTLNQNGIHFQIENTSSPIDPLLIGSSLSADIRLKLYSEDFSRADKVLNDFYARQIQSVPADYYLYDFSNDELLEILQKPDEWGTLDYSLAPEILRQRGVDTTENQLLEFKSNRLKEVAQTEKLGRSWILLGYFIAFVFSPLGVFFASAILTFKKTLPDGDKVFSYHPDDRWHGKRILIISVLLSAIWLWFRVNYVRD
jgi:hypothetical protein